jgi:hypothetical protein
MPSITVEQINAAMPPVPTVGTPPAGVPRRDLTNQALQALRSDVAALETGKADSAHTQLAASISDSTPAGRALLTAADVAAQRTALAVESTTQLNTRDTANRSRANHTGTQAISTVAGLQTALDTLDEEKLDASAAVVLGAPLDFVLPTDEVVVTRGGAPASAVLEVLLDLARPNLRNSQAARKKYIRPHLRRRSEVLMAIYPPSTAALGGGTIYIDPTVAGPGTGTFTDPFLAMPAVAGYAGRTVLFRERTTFVGNISTSNAASYDFGTYSASDGTRIFDIKRAAHIFANGASNCFSFSGLGANTLRFAGIKLSGARNAAGTGNGIFGGNSTPGSTLIVEHCDLSDCEGSSVGALLSARCERNIIRFNRMVGNDLDIIWSQAPATLPNYTFECYGNELILLGATRDGPDVIQLNRTTTGLFRNVWIYANWIEHRAGSKQGIIANGGTLSAQDRILIDGNYLFGLSDVTSVPDLSGDGSSQVAIQVDTLGGLHIRSNYIDGWRRWCASVRGTDLARSSLAGNVCYTDGPSNQTSFEWFGTSSTTTSHVLVANNTLITVNPMVLPGNVAAMRVAGLNNVVVNNLFVGPWSRGLSLDAAQAESGNAFVGVTVPMSNFSGVARAPTFAVPGDRFAVDPFGRALPGQWTLTAGVPVTEFSGDALVLDDVFGERARASGRIGSAIDQVEFEV